MIENRLVNAVCKGKMHLRVKCTPVVGDTEGYLMIYIIEARDLPVSDSNDLSDPYIQLSLKYFQVEKGQLVEKTKV